MANDEFRSPVVGPDPTVAQGLATKGYVDTNTVIPGRQIIAGTGLTGGGTLAADRTLAVAYGTAAGTAAQGNDARLSDARTPTAHAASHASGGSDPITPASIGAQAAGSYQPLDSDLTTIAGLTPTTDNIIQSVSGSWASRTPAQVKTSLALAKADVGLGNVDNTSDANKPISTATQTALDGKQPLDTQLTALAALAPSADQFAYFTSASAAGLATVTSFARTLLDDADAATMRATLGAQASGSYQPLDTDLTTIAGLTATTDNVIQSVAGAWASRTPAQLKATLALVKADVGLSNVDNTADTAKPVSTAQQTALDGKRDHNQAPRTGSASTSISIDGSLAGDVDLTCTGDVTITPTGTPNGRTLVITCLASGAQRTPAIVSSVPMSAGVTSRSVVTPSGGKCRFILRYSSLGTAGWSLDSAFLVG